MSDRSAFLVAIIAAPDDDTPRLVFADWLQERGEDARAEFIRVQCELARLRNTKVPRKVRQEPRRCKSCGQWYGGTGKCGCERGDRRSAILTRLEQDRRGRLAWKDWLEARERELEGGHQQDWVAGLEGLYGTGGWNFTRGFVAHVTCTAAWWLAHADALHWHPSQGRPCPETAQPLEKVTLTTWPAGLELVPASHADDRGVTHALSLRYPGIEFELPANVGTHAEPIWEPMG